jgi:hypothetical protein
MSGTIGAYGVHISSYIKFRIYIEYDTIHNHISYSLNRNSLIYTAVLSQKNVHRQICGPNLGGARKAWVLALASSVELGRVFFSSKLSPSKHIPGFISSIVTMLSLRALTRSVPRFSRSVARTSLRPTTLAKSAIAQPWKQTIKPAYAAFSTASIFREPAGEGE